MNPSPVPGEALFTPKNLVKSITCILYVEKQRRLSSSGCKLQRENAGRDVRKGYLRTPHTYTNEEDVR